MTDQITAVVCLLIFGQESSKASLVSQTHLLHLSVFWSKTINEIVEIKSKHMRVNIYIIRIFMFSLYSYEIILESREHIERVKELNDS